MALNGSTVWEVRTAGNDDNGAGFTSGGTDYSQQDSAQLTPTDLAMTTATTTLTSAAGGFTSAMIGNLIQIRSGTNFTTGFYEITAHTDTNTVTIDRDATTGSNASGGSGNVGGAVANPGTIGGEVVNSGSLSGNVVHIRNGTYTISSSTANIANGRFETNADKLRITGYNTTRGDLDLTNDSANRPILQATVDMGDAALVYMQNLGAADGQTVMNVIFDLNGQSNCIGVRTGDNSNRVANCKSIDGEVGFDVGYFFNCRADDATVVGFDNGIYSRCIAIGCEVGFRFNSSQMSHHCLARNGVIGFQTSVETCLTFCVAHQNSSDGFDLVGGATFHSCLSTNNGGYGFDTGNTDERAAFFSVCAGYSNTSGNFNGTTTNSYDFVTLTADPYEDESTNDLRPNNTAGGGAELRAKGMILPTQTNQINIGAIQHEDPAGGGMLTHPGMGGGMSG